MLTDAPRSTVDGYTLCWVEWAVGVPGAPFWGVPCSVRGDMLRREAASMVGFCMLMMFFLWNIQYIGAPVRWWSYRCTIICTMYFLRAGLAKRLPHFDGFVAHDKHFSRDFFSRLWGHW